MNYKFSTSFVLNCDNILFLYLKCHHSSLYFKLILPDGSSYYKRAFGEFFLANDANENKSVVSMTGGHTSQYHRFGWLVFLALRVHAFGRFKSLVTCTSGLVSILVSYIPTLFLFYDLDIFEYIAISFPLCFFLKKKTK